MARLTPKEVRERRKRLLRDFPAMSIFVERRPYEEDRGNGGDGTWAVVRMAGGDQTGRLEVGVGSRARGEGRKTYWQDLDMEEMLEILRAVSSRYNYMVERLNSDSDRVRVRKLKPVRGCPS